jgi:hypothetical protein
MTSRSWNGRPICCPSGRFSGGAPFHDTPRCRFGITFGALGIGAATGQGRAVAFGATAGIGVLAYAVNGFAPQIHAEWLRYLSPFHYYIGGEPLTNGLQLTDSVSC